jgi:selenocysteine lyase/cysteine desulfurase
LSEIPGIEVRDLGERKGGIVTFTHDRVPAEQIAAALASAKINITTSSIFSTRFDMEARGLSKLCRASVHYLTTDAEIETLAQTVASAVA